MTTRVTSANRITWIGFLVNLSLTVIKFVAGVFGHSGAMIADAVHSLSDFATDIVVLASFKLVGKPVDKSHDFGHGKFETLATAIIGVSLLLVGVGIFWDGAVKIWDSMHGTTIPTPGYIALAGAVVSILIKEGLYRYTVRVGTRISSPAVIANAWHHRSDAFSSIAALLGIGGAIMLGEKWHILDPLAAVAVSFFIVKVAVEIASGSIRELTEESLDESMKGEILQIAAHIPGVVDPHNLRTRRIGSDIAVNLHVRVDAEMNVADAHGIASRIEADLRARFGESAFISIHVEPLSKEKMQIHSETKETP